MGGHTMQNSDVILKRGVLKASKVTDELVQEAKAIAVANFGEQPDPAVVAAVLNALAITHASMLANPLSF